MTPFRASRIDTQWLFFDISFYFGGGVDSGDGEGQTQNRSTLACVYIFDLTPAPSSPACRLWRCWMAHVGVNIFQHTRLGPLPSLPSEARKMNDDKAKVRT